MSDLSTPRKVIFADDARGTDPWVQFARQTIRPPAHVYRRRRLAVLIVTAVLTVIGLGINDGTIRDEAPPTGSPDLLDPCQEDESCWDCSTMGNRICGPSTTITLEGR